MPRKPKVSSVSGKSVESVVSRRKRKEPAFVAEQAALYGIKVPSRVPPTERYISPNEAGRLLNITGEAVKQWIYQRRLPATKLSNGYWKVKVSDLEEFMKARHNLNQKKILIVDHPGSSLQDLVAAFEKSGHQAVVAHNSADALLKANDLFPALFVVNVSLDNLDGWKLIEKVRKTRNIKNMPVLVISDRELKEAESEQALDLGIQASLSRPIKSGLVVDEANRVLNRVL